MRLTYRGSVNNWECDENGHLNVRFYVEKHWQTLCGGLCGELGVLQLPCTPDELQQKVSVQHIRFLQESRLAAPLSGYVGVVFSGSGYIDVLTELRQSFTDEPVSACVHRIVGAIAEVTDELPQHARPRGLADVDLAHNSVALADVDSYGFKTIGMGLVSRDECIPDASGGFVRMHNYMGRISDSMPHLWGLLRAESGMLDETEGGAVLEYRLRYHQPLRPGQRFLVTSGVNAVSAKVQRFAHLLFNIESGSICVSAEAAGVRMDLLERRAKVLSEDMQNHMRSRLIRPFTG